MSNFTQKRFEAVSVALRDAAIVGEVYCIRVLHSLGANIHACDANGISSAFLADEKGHVKCIQLLHELNVDLNKLKK